MMRHLLFVLSLFALLGVGCNTAVSEPTPTQTATPIPSPTAVATEVIVTETAVAKPSPTNTPIPTNTPVPSPSPTPFPVNFDDGYITNVILSSQGQLAYIRNEILYVESAPQSRKFEELGQYPIIATWSPDGSQLFYSKADRSSAGYDDAATIYDQRIWSANDGSDMSLTELITNYPTPLPNIEIAYWTSDGTKILLQENLKEEEVEENNYLYHFRLGAVDLSSKTLLENQLINSNQHVTWISDDVYVTRFLCGSPCLDIAAYDYEGNLLWSPYWTTGGFFAFAPKENFMINVGRIDTDLTDDIPTEPYLPTLDKIDLATGDVEVIWNLPVRDEYFTPFIMPSISPDEQHFTFNFGGGVQNPGTLYVVDNTGNELGQYSNSFPVGWRENGDLVIAQMLETGESQLKLISLDGAIQSIFTTDANVKIDSGIWGVNGDLGWSPDGRYFIFSTEDTNNQSAWIYIWNHELEEPLLIHSIEGSAFQNFNWLPDSTGVYFTSGSKWEQEAIWYFDVSSRELELIAPIIVR